MKCSTMTTGAGCKTIANDDEREQKEWSEQSPNVMLRFMEGHGKKLRNDPIIRQRKRHLLNGFDEMRNINLGDASTQLDTLSEDEREHFEAANLLRYLFMPATEWYLNQDPLLVEAAVENAKANLHGLSSSAVKVRHVETFSDNEKEVEEERAADTKALQPKGNKKKRKNKKKWKQATKVENATGKVTLKKQKQK
ncbi:hypothetical protein L7F22_061918 [Adiantum nelumboides]|nr:hypothetical protein [Adiantum nelumboides]